MNGSRSGGDAAPFSLGGRQGWLDEKNKTRTYKCVKDRNTQLAIEKRDPVEL
jgi:hypothetical protein